MKTKAAVLVGKDKPLEIWELEIPKLKEGQVLVDMVYSGVCQNQYNEIKCRKGHDPFIPHTMGHEGTGVVLEIGPGVTKVKPGDHVVLSWIKGRGHNVLATQYRAEDGTIVNSGGCTTFLDKTVVSENRVVPIPKEMPMREGSLLGCAIPTGAGVIKNEMKLKAGDSYALFGAGGVGLSSLLAATAAKADPIIVVDIQENRLEQAKRLGATHLINASQEDPVAKIKEITGGEGVDFAFESAGRGIAMENAFASLKMPGLFVLAGNLAKDETISINPYHLICGKRIVGTWGGKSQIDDDVAYYVDLFLKGGIAIGDLITHEYKLHEINQLMTELGAGRVGRAIIDLTAASMELTESCCKQAELVHP